MNISFSPSVSSSCVSSQPSSQPLLKSSSSNSAPSSTTQSKKSPSFCRSLANAIAACCRKIFDAIRSCFLRMCRGGKTITPLERLPQEKNVLQKKEPVPSKTAVVKPEFPKMDLGLIITDGYGELIVFAKDGNKIRPANKEEFASIYPIFQKYAPSIGTGEKPLSGSRIELIRAEMQKVNPNLVGTFIPRTLFDLIFLRNCIDEDLKKQKNYPFEDPNNPKAQEMFYARHHCNIDNNSWCADASRNVLRILKPAHLQKASERLIELGMRLNKAACEILTQKGYNGPLTLGQIDQLVEEQVQFLQAIPNDKLAPSFVNCSFPTPCRNFSTASSRGSLTGMAVTDEKLASLIKESARLECRSIGKILFYRGGKISSDAPLHQETKTPYSLSFGSSLFAGVVNDGGATAFAYMHRDRLDAYVLVIDPTEENSELFRLPPYTALESLYGYGESWHGRSKGFAHPEDNIHGFAGSYGFDKEKGEGRFEPFKSRLPASEFIPKYQDFIKRNFVLLKPGK